MRKTLLLLSVAIFFATELMAQTQQVGFTTYDLQTNTTVCRRVAANAAGEVVITYTRSHAFSEAATDRGTGYNFWNGSAWSTDFSSFNNSSPGTFTRPDVGRTGWPNAAILRSGREVVISHFAGSAGSFGGLQVQYRDTPGTGSWNTVELNETEDLESTWPRIGVSGDSIIVISSVQIGNFVNGVDGGINVYRSFDGGETWTSIDVIDVINTDYFTAIGADVYAIDANDNGVVSIVTGRYQINLIKSMDFGETWTITPIKQTFDSQGNLNPDNFSGTFGETLDTVDLSDEAYSVVVDDNGLTHVWYGRQRLYKADAGTEGAFFFPFQTGLVYWNENMDEPKLLHETRLPAEQVEQCAHLFANDPNQFQSGTYRASFTSLASGAYSDNGNVYVAYAAIRGAIIDANDNVTNFSNPDNLQFRDIFLLKSEDNGQTWVGPYNVSNEERRECSYPGIPRKVFNDVIPVLWQEDTIPGNALQPPQGMNHPYVENEMNLVFVNDADIVSPADITCPTIGLVNANNTTITVLQGCPPSDEELSEFIVIDDIPQGPDYGMIGSEFNPNNFNVPGTYTVNIWAEDDAGNLSFDTLEGLTIIVEADLIPPTVDFIGFDTLAVIIGNTYIDPGINFSDNGCEPSITSESDDVNPTGTQTAGTFGTYSYIVTDNAGNFTEVIRYVEYISTDVTPPTITILGDEIEEIEACSDWIDQGAVAFDNVDFNVTNNIVVTGVNAVDVFTPADYVITYTVQDNAGNESTAERIVRVEDTTPPEVIVGDENGNWYVYLGDSYVAPTVTTSDCVDPAPTVSDNAGTQVDNTVNGNYLVTFTAEDFSGNVGTASTNVIVGVEPIADFNLVQVGANIIVSNASTNNPTFWSWDYGNGQVFQGPNPPSPTYQPSDPTYPTYEICLTVRNRFNDAPFNKTVSEKCETVTVPTSIIERNQLDAAVSVFPNPTQGDVNISISDLNAQNVVITITDIIGSVVAVESLGNINTNINQTINLSGKASGMYIVNIATSKTSISKKVMVE